MRFGRLNSHNLRRYGLAILTVALTVLLATHPELRLLVPVIDALGLDVFLLLCGAQALSWGNAALQLYGRPLLRTLYRALLYFLGIAGPGVDALVRSHLHVQSPRVAV